MQALVDTFNQEKALVGAFSVIVKFSRRFIASSTAHRLLETETDSADIILQYFYQISVPRQLWINHWEFLRISVANIYTWEEIVRIGTREGRRNLETWWWLLLVSKWFLCPVSSGDIGIIFWWLLLQIVMNHCALSNDRPALHTVCWSHMARRRGL